MPGYSTNVILGDGNNTFIGVHRVLGRSSATLAHHLCTLMLHNAGKPCQRTESALHQSTFVQSVETDGVELVCLKLHTIIEGLGVGKSSAFGGLKNAFKNSAEG